MRGEAAGAGDAGGRHPAGGSGAGYVALGRCGGESVHGVHRADRARAGARGDCDRRLMFAFGEGGSKSALAGIIFGLGMALGAANFITWMF